MISALITSQTRVKLLQKFFINSSTIAHLRGLEAEFKESSNAIRLELNRFEKAGLLSSRRDGNKKVYKANLDHPLFGDIHNILLKEAGIDKVIEKVILRIRQPFSVYLTGDFARGKDSSIIELILLADDNDMDSLVKRVAQVDRINNRKVHFTIIHSSEARERLQNMNAADLLLLWDTGRKGKQGTR